MTITAAYGPDVAKTAFDHQMKHNALDQHYSSGVGLYDFAAMIYGEEVSPRADLVRSSKISAIQRSGQGPKALVHNASNPAPVGKRKVVIGRLDDLFLEKESYRAAFELLQELREQLERATGVDMTSQKKLRGRQFGLARRMLGDGAHDDLLSQAIEAKKNEGDIRRQLQGQMKRKASKEEQPTTITTSKFSRRDTNYSRPPQLSLRPSAPDRPSSRSGPLLFSVANVEPLFDPRTFPTLLLRTTSLYSTPSLLYLFLSSFLKHQDLQTSSSSCETSILLSRVPLVCALANDLSEGPLDLDLDLKSPDRQIDMSSHASTSPSLPGRRPRVHHQQHHDDGLDVPTLDPRTLATVAEMRTMREDSHARFDAVTVRLTAVEQQHQHRPERGEPVDNSVGIDPAATVDHGRRTSIAPIHPPPDRNRASADTAWSPALLDDRFVTTSRGPTRPRPAHPPITPRQPPSTSLPPQPPHHTDRFPWLATGRYQEQSKAGSRRRSVESVCRWSISSAPPTPPPTTIHRTRTRFSTAIHHRESPSSAPQKSDSAWTPRLAKKSTSRSAPTSVLYYTLDVLQLPYFEQFWLHESEAVTKRNRACYSTPSAAPSSTTPPS
ncbi:hypothetical protein A4X06_0g4713 [Tilletia controversa]|uniref:Uncharacterized protein n=1 Tax=Tilletia controversa TaxID=13291 RepID=A0A8X7MT43_9BASI|nr:hypothetical protein A4X06_0g4713 [Tilletia controversa]